MLQITEFVKVHQNWSVPIVFVLALAESVAFLSLLVPATIILIGIGALIGETGIAFLPIWIAAAIGAFLGDWLSYWFGYHYKEQVGHLWPLSRKPELLVRGHTFFTRWGVIGVFIGRFFGPLRAIIPLVAGICGMEQRHFQIANITSALLWATLMLTPGAFGLPWITHFLD